MNVFNLFAKIGLNTDDYEKGLNKSKKAIQSFASKVSTTIKGVVKVFSGLTAVVSSVAPAISAFALKAINTGDEIDKMSQKLGLSSDAYQKWSLAAEMAGTDAATLQTGIRQLTTFTEKLSKGQGDALLSLQSLGVGYEDFMSMSFDDQLKTIVDAMQGVEDQTEKTRLAQELFGSRAYQELLPLLNQEKGSIDELFQSFEDGGLIMDEQMIKKSAELNDQLTILKSTAKTTANMFALEFATGVSDVTQGLQALLQNSEGATDQISEGLLAVTDKFVEKAPQLMQTIAELAIKLVNGLAENNVMTKLVQSLVTVFEAIIGVIIDGNKLTIMLNMLVEMVVTLLNSLAKINWKDTMATLTTTLLNAVLDLIKTAPTIIKDLLSIGWEIIKGVWKGIGDFIFGEEGLSGIWNKVKNWVHNKFDGIGKWFKNIGIRIVNGIIDGLNKLGNFTIPGLKLGDWQVWDDKEVSWWKIPKIKEEALGGMIDGIGTFYRAGERGAEIVAQGSRGTGVANIDQIAQAQYNAMGDYGGKEEIKNAAKEIVRSINAIGEEKQQRIVSKKNVLDALVDGVNQGLYSQGRKTLKQVTAF